MIQQELRSPIKIFKVQDDGTETVEYKPPTSLMLRAANHIDQLIKTIEVLQIELNNIKGGVQWGMYFQKTNWKKSSGV